MRKYQTDSDSIAANLRTANYTPNALNQYTAITHPGLLEIYGKAPIAQAVTVSGLATTRQGRDFRRELSFPNPTQRWESIVTNGGSLSTSQHHLPAASTAPTYDLDVNQTSEGQWNYTWDAENRLSTATRTAAAITAGAPYRAISYTYDSRSRKITRSVATTSGGAITTEKFLYDGWNCIAEYTGTTLKKSYLWGMDLSGTLQSAGGVGGLLLITDHSAPLTSHYPCYDGNGNIRKLLHATTLATTATYDYAPFGELTRATGSYAATNSYRFSTKPQDVDTGLVYYNYRPYDTKTGRWLSRDPIGERGGVNLYGFVGNDGVNWVDILGLDRLVYDGKKLCRLSDDLKECKKCWEAVSGKPIDKDGDGKPDLDKDGKPIFDYSPENQKKPNTGPIPEGDYELPGDQTIDPSKDGNWNTDDWNKYEDSDGNGWKPWKTNVGPRNTAGWGDCFGRLKPSGGTNTHGRSNFNIHGGKVPGSAGCIDVGCNDKDLYDNIRKDFEGKNVPVNVDYSGASSKACDTCKESKGNPWPAK